MAAVVTEIRAESAAPESKRERFVRLAERRTSNALRSIRVIGNLANKLHYEFDASDVKKITTALHKEVDSLGQRFERVPGKSKAEFKL
jgi:hypothetical protein